MWRSFIGRCGLSACLVAAAAVPSTSARGQSREAYARAREAMVNKVIIGSGIKDKRVIQAMAATPRHEFVPLPLRPRAYFDMSLPIGEKQTISSPYIVAFMTEALDPQPTDKVLEIGTGSGYQAAVLAPLVKAVYTIEIVEPLARRAERTLRRLKYKNVYVKAGDGYKGWPEKAPFDKIIVTCSPEKAPRPLVEQLAEGGRIVIPVGQRHQQTLFVLKKVNGKLEAEPLRPTLFVPMTGVAESVRKVKPDPANPKLANSDFEQPANEYGFVPAWYYQRQMKWENEDPAPKGKNYITLRNEEVGRPARLMQGFAIDGTVVKRIRLEALIRTRDVRPGAHRQALPTISVTFFDKDRRTVGHVWLGPWIGDNDWRRVARTWRAPPTAREGVVRISMNGAVGEASFDNVRLSAVKPGD